MRKLIILLLLVAALQGCRQYCFNCHDISGAPAGNKCFHTQDDLDVWFAAQTAANPYQPVSCK